MGSHLIELERRALRARKLGHIKEAAELFSAIVKERPDWEHGIGLYNLARCYEDLGKLQLAEECYDAAIRYQPASRDFLGGLASFLYLHHAPEKAFNAYPTVLEIYRIDKDQEAVASATTALRALGRKMGISEDGVTERINKTPL